jgi:hypothetical protein
MQRRLTKGRGINRHLCATAIALPVALAGTLLEALNRPADAFVFNIKNEAIPEIEIQVGSGGKAISTVAFDVPLDGVGTGVPVAGNRSIRIRLIIRSPASNPVTGILTVDSASPLRNGSGATIPASDISWTARHGDIPSATYAGSANQLLVTYTGSVRVDDWHTFSYGNRSVYDAGTYSGQVTYTWSAP